MTNDEKLIKALEGTIAAQKDLIDHLKREIEYLNVSRLYINTPSTPPKDSGVFPFIQYPPTQPYMPTSPYPPYSPNNEWTTIYSVVTDSLADGPQTVGLSGTLPVSCGESSATSAGANILGGTTVEASGTNFVPTYKEHNDKAFPWIANKTGTSK